MDQIVVLDTRDVMVQADVDMSRQRRYFGWMKTQRHQIITALIFVCTLVACEYIKVCGIVA